MVIPSKAILFSSSDNSTQEWLVSSKTMLSVLMLVLSCTHSFLSAVDDEGKSVDQVNKKERERERGGGEEREKPQ